MIQAVIAVKFEFQEKKTGALFLYAPKDYDTFKVIARGSECDACINIGDIISVPLCFVLEMEINGTPYVHLMDHHILAVYRED